MMLLAGHCPSAGAEQSSLYLFHSKTKISDIKCAQHLSSYNYPDPHELQSTNEYRLFSIILYEEKNPTNQTECVKHNMSLSPLELFIDIIVLRID